VLGFPKHNEVANMCWLCKAGISDPTLRYTDVTSSAGWRKTLRTTSFYAKELESRGKSLPVLLSSITGFGLQHVMIDTLHTVELGVASHIVGNIMKECMTSLGPNQDMQVKALEADLKLWYKIAGKDIHRIKGKLTPDRLKMGSGYPKFKGKAAETRHLAGWALDLCQRFNSGSEHDLRRLALAQMLLRFYTIIKSEGLCLALPARQEIHSLGSRLVILYNALSCEAAASEIKAWKISPKFHLFVHLCEIQAQWMNPRMYWCYADEDLVGQAIEVSRSCHASTVADTAIYKWLLLHFQ
jgi:hypothetical protein